jgi:hypothetical protein
MIAPARGCSFVSYALGRVPSQDDRLREKPFARDLVDDSERSPQAEARLPPDRPEQDQADGFQVEDPRG